MSGAVGNEERLRNIVSAAIDILEPVGGMSDAEYAAWQAGVAAARSQARAALAVTPEPGAAEAEIAYRLNATLEEAALAGVTLDARNRADLARLLPAVTEAAPVLDAPDGTAAFVAFAVEYIASVLGEDHATVKAGRRIHDRLRASQSVSESADSAEKTTGADTGRGT